jgi:uncharacterized protein YidB (DUF937 family)
MGLLDQLGGLLGENGGEGQSANIVGTLLQGAGGAAPGGGMTGMLETLAANGLGEHVASWTSGAGLPVSPEQIQSALGSEQVQQMAQASGLPVGDFLQHLADHLPGAAAAQAGA